MQGKHLYEYAVIRFVPKVEREEFVNVGLILFSKRAGFIKSRYVMDNEKLCSFTTEVDTDALRESLDSFDKICSGSQEGGHIASFEVHERFRWLTSVRSTCVQTSRPHAGFSSDLDATFDRLFRELVL